jgi:hypothetical protein
MTLVGGIQSSFRSSRSHCRTSTATRSLRGSAPGIGRVLIALTGFDEPASRR